MRRCVAAFVCGLTLAACAGTRAADAPQTETQPQPHQLPEALLPPPGVRVPAEWEPAVGAVVTYPFEIPLELVAALAQEELLFVLVRTEDQQALRDELRANDLPRRRIQSIASAHGLPYTRDFGPHQIELPGGELAVLDQVFDGYPMYSSDADRGAADAEVWRFPARGADDRVAEACAAHFDLVRFVVPFSLTGGNFLVDGRGTAFFTDALVDENLVWHSREEFFELLTRCTGATNLVHLPNIEGVGIQHVDCWIKVLPGNRLLVQRAPEGHPLHARLEAAVLELERVRDTSGAPFEILRIDCPVVERDALGDEAPLAAYTNALILNTRVHVPLYGVPGDEAALATWRAALPEHDVQGYVYADWQGFDALHCRTRAIFAGARREQAQPEREPR